MPIIVFSVWPQYNNNNNNNNANYCVQCVATTQAQFAQQQLILQVGITSE